MVPVHILAGRGEKAGFTAADGAEFLVAAFHPVHIGRGRPKVRDISGEIRQVV